MNLLKSKAFMQYAGMQCSNFDVTDYTQLNCLEIYFTGIEKNRSRNAQCACIEIVC